MIKRIKFLFLLAVVLIALFLGFSFSSENSQLIQPVLFSYLLPSLPVGFWLMIALLTGAIIGFILSKFSQIWKRSSHSAKDKKIKLLEKEINTLRTSGLKG